MYRSATKILIWICQLERLHGVDGRRRIDNAVAIVINVDRRIRGRSCKE